MPFLPNLLRVKTDSGRHRGDPQPEFILLTRDQSVNSDRGILRPYVGTHVAIHEVKPHIDWM